MSLGVEVEPGPFHPRHWALRNPDRPAIVIAESGEQVTFEELDRRSSQLARLLRARGLRRGSHLAVFMENNTRFHEVVWAGLRSGLIVTTINRYLSPAEAAYIVNDCAAAAIVTSAELIEIAEPLADLAPGCEVRLMVGGSSPRYETYEQSIALQQAETLETEFLGAFMLYSSGTTGKPKTIMPKLTDRPVGSGLPLAAFVSGLFGFDESTIYLSPAPLYHSAPLMFTIAVQAGGGTAVVMEHFDPEEALSVIDRFGVTHSQWVPTMFSRMLKLPQAKRDAFDLSRHQMAIHAAAPCPRVVKEQMFDWWGPILHEYYGGTEPSGLTYCGPEEWLAHPGTVGRAVTGLIHVCEEDGNEVPTGAVGSIFFEQKQPAFTYHGPQELSTSSRHPQHDTWTTLGDVGWVDDEGFLYLSDRASFMIISGGVNIYPQETEDCLVVHPDVEDAAVFGVPNLDLGEEVKAVVQLRPGVERCQAMEQALIGWCKSRIAHFKCPRSIDFVDTLPRLPTGKLYKRQLRDQYWADRESRII